MCVRDLKCTKRGRIPELKSDKLTNTPGKYTMYVRMYRIKVDFVISEVLFA